MWGAIHQGLQGSEQSNYLIRRREREGSDKRKGKGTKGESIGRPTPL